MDLAELRSLGDRVLDAIPSPGHDEPAVTWYDRSTRLLLTGDTLYPGRLYVDDWPAFTATVDRLLAFAEDHPVDHLLGAHIEMTRSPGVDYVVRTTYQPEEPPLELGLADLATLDKRIQRAQKSMKGPEAKTEKVVLELCQRIVKWLDEGKPVRAQGLTDDEKALIADMHLLTSKKVFFVANVAEKQLEARPIMRSGEVLAHMPYVFLR